MRKPCAHTGALKRTAQGGNSHIDTWEHMVWVSHMDTWEHNEHRGWDLHMDMWEHTRQRHQCMRKERNNMPFSSVWKQGIYPRLLLSFKPVHIQRKLLRM